MAYLNQHSFTIASLVALALLAATLLRDGATLLDFVALSAIASVLCLSWQAIRPGPSSVADLAAVEAAFAAKRPILLEFQSEY